MIDGWVILEILGHRQLAGLLSEETVAGAAFLRIDVPEPDGAMKTSYYGPASVYAIHPTDEATVRKLNALRPPLPAPYIAAQPDFDRVDLWDDDARDDEEDDEQESGSGAAGLL